MSMAMATVTVPSNTIYDVKIKFACRLSHCLVCLIARYRFYRLYSVAFVWPEPNRELTHVVQLERLPKCEVQGLQVLKGLQPRVQAQGHGQQGLKRLHARLIVRFAIAVDFAIVHDVYHLRHRRKSAPAKVD